VYKGKLTAKNTYNSNNRLIKAVHSNFLNPLLTFSVWMEKRDQFVFLRERFDDSSSVTVFQLCEFAFSLVAKNPLQILQICFVADSFVVWDVLEEIVDDEHPSSRAETRNGVRRAPGPLHSHNNSPELGKWTRNFLNNKGVAFKLS